ncbi:anthranilate phosphoribosyltransferase [Salinisphaera sp. Q1T1-3]|uniref:anthranilate phosphoribosyltransferase n=1 Tax=Salinisphaera sp. Q1T1-3 TaxID=2321229 RepID=UPI000E74E646|nr:anthranilate phosphoribosyltransferase [Salinisphaera sp. Q1T1-3]RJS93538.1 anthranilate phosphoribosyltransferase [Salinisphaera sp. Q1T1-3]
MIDAALLDDIARGRDLDGERMAAAMRSLMTGGAEDSQIGAFLMGLRIKGETIEEIAAAAAVMRELATPVPVDDALADSLVDTCGTGGDGAGIFNVSTAAAIVAAAAGGHVAKHGNRSVSSKSGSADLLERAGIALETSPADVGACIRELGAGFMFAPAHHGAMKHAVPVRKALGIRTLFNLLGPLTNPAGARNQLMGVFNGHLCEPLAHVLHRLGSRHVMVVHGEDGLDELSINAPTRVAELKDGTVRTYKIAPEDVGLERATLDTLRVADAQQSLVTVRDVLSGRTSPAADIVAFNAGAALYVGGVCPDLATGVARAKQTIESGVAARRLVDIADFTHRRAQR